MATLRTMWDLARAAVRGQMQYRASFLIEVLAGVAFQGLGFVFIWAVIERFSAIGGWSLTEIALIYGIRLTAHGLFQVVLGGIMRLDDLVKSGGFDRYLIRPIHPLLQLMCMSIRMSTFGDLVGGAVLLGVVLPQLDIAWSPPLAVLLLASILGGALIEASLQLAPASLSFSFLESWPVIRITDDAMGSFGNYPLHIFQQPLRWLFTFVLPIAFVAYLPACALLGRHTWLPGWISWLSPVIGVGMMTLAVGIFTRAIRAYQSAGS